MLLGNPSRSFNRSPTPTKGSNRNRETVSPFKQKSKKSTTNINPASSLNNSSSMSSSVKYRSKDSLTIIQGLEEIYHHLTFNEFEAFPINNIFLARKKINDLYEFYKGESMCPKHNDLLNLYCESDKEVICVSCVYKPMSEHRNHKIKSLESVEKTLDYETIRNDEKCKALVHQLLEIKDEIKNMEVEVQDQYEAISNYTNKIFQECKDELDVLKRDMEKKLNTAYNRTNTVISRYREALEEMTGMIESNIRKGVSAGRLSKYLLLRCILNESHLIDDLILKFNENKLLIEQWKRSTRDFQKVIVRKKFEPTTKVDTYEVTQF